MTAIRPPGAASTAAGSGFELAELVVDRDAQRLEDTFGRMPVSESSWRRQRGLDHVDELPVRSNGRSLRRRTMARAIWRA